MKKFKFGLIVFGIFYTLSGYAQEEFFGEKTGLSVSGTTDFTGIFGGGMSLHLKNGLIFSYSSINASRYIPIMVTAGYLFDLNKKSEKDKLNAFISLSDVTTLSDLFKQIGYVSPSFGIMYTSFYNFNYPTSLGISASAYFDSYNYASTDAYFLNFYFAQAFFAKKTVYPIVGLTYSLPIKQSYYGFSQGEGSLEFHVGLNIRLSKPD